MRLHHENRYRAIAIAPMFSGFGLWVSLFIHDSKNCLEQGASCFLYAPFTALPISYFFSFLTTVVIGLPIYYFLKKIGYLNFLVIAFIGVPISALLSIVVNGHDKLWLQHFITTGFFVSFAAAVILAKKIPNKNKNVNAASGSDASKTR